jgi:hypothetical protein
MGIARQNVYINKNKSWKKIRQKGLQRSRGVYGDIKKKLVPSKPKPRTQKKGDKGESKKTLVGIIERPSD